MSKTICISSLIFTRFLHWLQGSNVNRRLLVTTRRDRQNKLRGRELKVILVCMHCCVTSVPRNTCTNKFRIALWGTTLLRLKHIINLCIFLGWQIRECSYAKVSCRHISAIRWPPLFFCIPSQMQTAIYTPPGQPSTSGLLNCAFCCLWSKGNCSPLTWWQRLSISDGKW